MGAEPLIAAESWAEDAAEELVEPSNTARTLRRLRVWMVAVSLVAAAACLLVFSRAHAAVDTLSNRSAPAVQEADAAYVALVDAEATSAHDVRTGTAALGGPGGQYQNDIAAADKSLSQLVGDNVAGPDAASSLQLIEDLVVGYNQQVEQAYADLAQRSDNPLAVVDLSYSTRQAGELLGDLGKVRDAENAALTAKQSSAWLTGISYVVWIPGVVAAIALVAASHTLIRRRFRRRLNLRLAAAGVALAAMGLLCGLSLQVSESDLDSGLRGPLALVTQLSDTQATDLSDAGSVDLYHLVTRICPGGGTCGAQVSLPPKAHPADELAPAVSTLATQQTQDESLFASAAATADAAYVARSVTIGVLALAAAGLSASGLRRHIDEYRFRER